MYTSEDNAKKLLCPLINSKCKVYDCMFWIEDSFTEKPISCPDCKGSAKSCKTCHGGSYYELNYIGHCAHLDPKKRGL